MKSSHIIGVPVGCIDPNRDTGRFGVTAATTQSVLVEREREGKEERGAQARELYSVPR